MFKRRHDDTISISEFCGQKGIPLNMEILFADYYRNYLVAEYNIRDLTLLTYLLSSRRKETLEKIWWNFIIDLKMKIDNT